MRSFVLVAAVALALAATTTSHPTFAGVWTLDREHSPLPAFIGFDIPARLLPTDSPAVGGGRRGGGMATPIVNESEDDAKRQHELIAELKDPPATLTITQTDTLVTIGAPDQATREFHVNKSDLQALKDITVVTTTKWVGEKLEVRYAVEPNRVLRYLYSRAGDNSPLVIEATPLDHGKGDGVTLVYTKAHSAPGF